MHETGKGRKHPSKVTKYALILAATWTLALAGFAVGQKTAPSGGEEALRRVRIGVLAKRGAERCLLKWGPTAEYLTAEIPGYTFSIVPLGYDEIAPAVERGEVDFVLANPACYVLVEHDYGARRVATLINLRLGQGHTEYAGTLFTRADRKDIERIADLEGKTFMAADEHSFGGWHMVWRKLKQKGFDPHRDFADLRFGGTHDAVVYAVRDGEVDAGSVRSDTLEHMAMEGKVRLEDFRIIGAHENVFEGLGKVSFLHSTRHYPEWPLAAVGNASDKLAEKVAVALFGMPRDSPAAQAARYMGWAIPADYTTVKECLQDIRVAPYEDYGKVTIGQALRQHWILALDALVLVLVSVVFGVYAVRSKRRIARSAQSLRDKTEFESSLIETAQVIILVLDTEGRILRFNPYMEQLSGYRLEEVRGKDWFSTFPPERDGDEIRELFQKAIGDIQTVGIVNAIVTKSGRELDVEWYDKTLKNAEGDTIGLLAVGQDVTERKRSEAERELLMSAIEQAAEVVVITDVEATIQYANPVFERITGYTRDEVIGRNPRILQSGEHDAAFYKEMWDSLTRGEAWSGRLVNKKKDGALFTEEAMISPVRDAAGQTVNYVAVKRDITNEIHLEDQLRQAQKMEAVGQLAGGVAHDFNNLLQAILGFGDLALGDVDVDSPARKDIEEIMKAGHRAATLVRQLLAFSRRQVLDMKDVDLNDVIADLMKMLRRVIGEHITLGAIAGHDLGTVRADPGQIEQILMNLCVNARDAMPEGGTITIETENVRIDEEFRETHPWAEPGRYALLSVTDTGCGMDEETLGNVFEPFFTTKDVGEGTGLGLSTVYGLVKQHEGLVHVYSEVGKGTTFKIYLPLIERAAAAVGDKIEGPAPGGTETILLAEDDETLLKLTKAILEHAGYTVLAAIDGEEAQRLFEDHADAIDLALLDVMMPKLGGKAVYERIREARPGVRVLFSSGYSMNAIHTNFVLDEGLALIQKPCQRDNLLRKVREALDSEQ